jgi:hypothetical protein
MDRKSNKVSEYSRPPALSPDQKENELISLAVDLAERQLREGTASSQVIAHYLKLGSSRERLEKERLISENRMLRAKTEALDSQRRTEELYANAIRAMREYQDISDTQIVDEVDE